MMLKYYIKTFGCQMNVSDSERIAMFLETQKFKPVGDINKAGLVVFNTCGVRQTAEDRVYGQIHNLRKNNPKIKIILTGCLANRKDVQKKLKEKVDLFCEIKDFPHLFSPFGKGRVREGFEKFYKELQIPLNPPFPKGETYNYLCITPKYSNELSAYVPIMTGCNNFCSYCVVPYARGREISRPAQDILKEINDLAKNGCKEITLLGQNVNSYHYLKPPSGSRGSHSVASGTLINFPNILNHLAQSYPKITFKFLTSHPKDFSDELMKVIAKNKNISREIHLPIQAGSDKILKAMNRPYTRKKYLNLIAKIKKIIPDASFTTDVIIGFPGETEKDFQETVKVFKKVKYNEAYINKYSPRPGTAAYELKDSISWEEKKRREKVLRKLVKPEPEVELLRNRRSSTSGFTSNFNNKIIVILGPTSSGKSDVAIKLAQKFNGEIISADSRQIYRGMDIGTGKVSKEEQKIVKHWALDIVSPKTEYNAAKFKKYADKIIADILKRGKLPIICGGTGFWIKAIVDNVAYPEVKPDWVLRNILRNKTAKELFVMLKKIDSERAKNIDKNNSVRLIRAIEICKSLGKVPKINSRGSTLGIPKVEPREFLQIGIDIKKEKLHSNIKKRLKRRFEAGMIKEVKRLKKSGLTWKKIQSFGLGYFWIPEYLKGKMTKEECFEKIYQAEKNYAKRQITWFGKDKRIKWLEEYKDIEKETRNFLKK